MVNAPFTYFYSVCIGAVQVVVALANDRQKGTGCQKAVDFVTGCYSLVQTKILGLSKVFHTHD